MTLAFHMMPLVGTILLLVSRRVSLLTAGLAGMTLAFVTMIAAQAPLAGMPDMAMLNMAVLTKAAVKAGEGAWLAWHAMSIIAAGLLFHRAYEARGIQSAAVAQENRRRAVFVACFLVGPFAESVTGFGVGLVVALAMLRHMGLPPVQAAALGLFSQVLAAWGAMGVGTRVGAELIGVTFTELGTASALLMAVVLPCLLPVFWGLIHGCGLRSTPRERVGDVGLLLCLAGLIWLTNRFVAPELGGGLATGVLLVLVEGPRLLRSDGGGPRMAMAGLMERLWPYVLLIAALMATRLLPPLSDWTATLLVLDPFGGLAPLALLRHPATWLVVIAAILLAGLPAAKAGEVIRGALRAALVPMAATLVFVEFAAFMAASGGAAMFGQAWREIAGRFAVLATPLFGGAAGMLTGSNTASNALMMHIQLSLAAESGLPPMLTAAIQTVSGSICTMLTPGRIVLAAGLVGLQQAEGAIYRRALPIGLATILSLLAVVVLMAGAKSWGLI
ncbi:L-lactate permease [Azospirillum humicireducens]|uniref:L-lactate permease n=1 Tax=Azospirillum humicireducens TaxID=1226968 RepID=A0A160JIL6_9PROT|nr:L-lactate permease [Azospirillum humicireducens]ANC92966.1 L-lactate permease [Azospirillum humicireducens]